MAQAKLSSFPTTGLQKNVQTIHCVFRGRFRSAERIAHHFQWIFPSIRSTQPVERKISIQTVSSQELGDSKSFCIKRLKTLNSYKIQD
jgi:hypothetical protein